MSKAFIKPKEAEYILNTYSKSFKEEFHKIDPCTYGTDYMYIISFCPELDPDGKDTGRILVNHFSTDGTERVPEFIDVWARDGEVLRFKSRNLPGTDIISAEERIRTLEEKLKEVKKQLKKQSSVSADSLNRLKMYEKLLREGTTPLPENVLCFSTHNARGAGRKKDPLTEVKRKKAIRLKEKGLTREEICKELDIGQTTYYRYINEKKGEE